MNSNSKRTGGREKKILDEQSDITAEKLTLLLLRDYSYTLCRTVKPLITTMTQHEKDFLLEKEKSTFVFNKNLVFLTLSVSEGQSRCFETPRGHYLSEG